MNSRGVLAALAVGVVAVAGLGRESAAQAPKFQKPAPYQLTDQERREVEDAIKAIERIPGNNTMPHDARAEVEVYPKAGVWALRERYTKRQRLHPTPEGCGSSASPHIVDLLVDLRLVLRYFFQFQAQGAQPKHESTHTDNLEHIHDSNQTSNKACFSFKIPERIAHFPRITMPNRKY
jgi:hypothetical protein